MTRGNSFHNRWSDLQAWKILLPQNVEFKAKERDEYLVPGKQYKLDPA